MKNPVVTPIIVPLAVLSPCSRAFTTMADLEGFIAAWNDSLQRVRLPSRWISVDSLDLFLRRQNQKQAKLNIHPKRYTHDNLVKKRRRVGSALHLFVSGISRRLYRMSFPILSLLVVTAAMSHDRRQPRRVSSRNYILSPCQPPSAIMPPKIIAQHQSTLSERLLLP